MASTSPAAHLFVDPPANGAWNMAVDEALLESALDQNCVFLRFYEWKEPTLSLGYFQSHSDRQQHAASINCPLVRRQSGGGAILHDRELTYSLVIPPKHELSRDAERLYTTVHQAIVTAMGLSTGDWLPKLWQAIPVEEDFIEPFLCFQRRSTGDVVLWNQAGEHHKIVGSAQRRRRGAILQHGSLLLNRSSAAPELAGLNDLANMEITRSSFLESLLEILPEKLQLGGFSPVKRTSSASHSQPLAAKLMETKYGHEKWLQRR